MYNDMYIWESERYKLRCFSEKKTMQKFNITNVRWSNQRINNNNDKIIIDQFVTIYSVAIIKLHLV